MQSYQTISVNVLGHTFTIDFIQDDYPVDPRENADTVICSANRKEFGDINLGICPKRSTPHLEVFKRHLKQSNLCIQDVVYSLVFLNEYNGYELSTKPFLNSWDSGQLGYIYITRQDARKRLNVSRLTKRNTFYIVDTYFRRELDVFTDYLNGEVYYWQCRELDCAGGDVYQHELHDTAKMTSVLDEVKREVEYFVRCKQRRHAIQLKKWIRSKVNYAYRKPLTI